jgi:alkanesulfonate monooxygenase SsuD/methylene tetrahydromethanopterin reductase-like flavin-dependent oxidoreductase (luciferase family)
VTNRLTFGFGMVSAQLDARSGQTTTDVYKEILELSEMADDLGIEAIWLTEHHFVDDGYLPSLLTVAAAIAARTARIRICTGVLLAPFYDAIRLAEDAAVVDLISRGRLTLGLGSGYRDEEFDGFDVDKSKAAEILESSISILRSAWLGNPIELQSGLSVRVTPRPESTTGPPIWIGARKGRALRRAARLADGFLAARVTPDEFGSQLDALDEELQRTGRRRDDVTVGVHCPVLALPDGSAWDLLKGPLHYVEWKYKDMVGVPFGSRTDALATTPPALTAEGESGLRSSALVGTPEQVASKINEYVDAAGDRPFHFIARLYWPGMEPALQRRALEVYAKDVIPLVRGSISH